MYKNNQLSKAVRLAMMFGATSTAAFSATVAAQEEAATKVERIEVTGSRIKRTDMETSSPVQVTSADEIKSSGFTRIEDMLNSLPQVEAADTSFSVNGATGTASLDLRGIGATRTLVLLNGRRLQPGGLYSSASDVNQIPAALVERVEILTGGGSATYGADAVAGVVNFVMKNDFEGVEINAGYSGYQHNNDNKLIQEKMDARGYEYKTGNTGLGGETTTLDITVGGSFAGGKGHATAFASYRNVEEMLQAERDYASCALNPSDLSCGGSGTAHIPNFDIYPWVNGDIDWNQNGYWSIVPNNGNTAFTDDLSVYNYAPVNHFMRPDKRFTLGSFANYQINEHANVYTEVNYMMNRTTGQIAESGIFFQNFTFDVNSPIFSQAQKDQFAQTFPGAQELEIYIGKRNTEGGGRQANLEHNSFRIVTGVEGAINDNWSYDVSYQYGSVSSSDAYKNDFYVNYMAQRLGAVGAPDCTGDCIPYEVFTYGGVTPEAAKQMQGSAIATGYTNQKILNGFVTGETGWKVGGHSMPIAAVFGLEKRDVFFSRTVDTIYAEGALAGQGGPTPDLEGGYKVEEVFSELSIPLLEDAGIAQNLILELGARYSDYSTSGGETAYKVALDWSMNDDWKARASYNKAVRAPNVGELFATQSIGLWAGEDICAGPAASLNYTAEQCARTGVTAAQYGNITVNFANQHNGLFGGNPDLQPEEGKTLTFGIVGNPFENFNFSVDYWDIEITNVISELSPSLILNQCAKTGIASYCDLINRAANGSLWLGETGYIVSTALNLGEERYRGIDLSANYTMALGAGKLSASFVGSHNLEKYYNPLPGVAGAEYDCSGLISDKCFPQPEWRHTATVNYNTGSFWDLTAKWRYFGEVKYEGSTNLLIGDKISAQSYIDLMGRFYVNEKVTVQLGVNNIFDKEPPLVGNVLANTNTIGGFWDMLGRYVHLNVTAKF